MANADDLEALTTWPPERWDRERPNQPDLSGADLSRAKLSAANLTGANLTGANLSGADLSRAKLSRARLSRANLIGANLSEAYLSDAHLGGANLIEANLTGANLSRADLTGANLTGADLSGANLDGADLMGADLSGANLSRADLMGASVIGANLSRADLSGADLSRANLMETNLTGAHLSEANLSETITSNTAWINVDMRSVVGLTEVRHRGPSSIGVDTLYASEGQISKEFLRGCGLPDYFVGLIPGLTVTAPIQHYAAFISYSHNDKAAASTIYHHLFDTSKIPTWLDEHEIEAGDPIMRSVDKAIRRVDKVILLCSEQSLNSWWVDEEIKRWTAKERRLKRDDQLETMVIPVDLDGYIFDCEHEYAETIKSYNILSAQHWAADNDVLLRLFDKLTRALRKNRQSPFETMIQAATHNPIHEPDERE